MPRKATNDQRAEERVRKTLFCELQCEGKCHPAVVLDISPRGLFIRTATKFAKGTEVAVTLRMSGGRLWELHTEVARDPQYEPSLKVLYARGVGLRIIHPPDGFAEFVENL